MKKITMIFILTSSIFAWEINTHRAIDRKAIEKSSNLTTFIKKSGIEYTTYTNEIFEGYGSGMTYRNYLINGEENGLSSDKWKQDFPSRMYAKDLLEAGSILEDAQWQHFLDGGEYNYWDKADGRFVNHFYDAQNGGHALTYGMGLRTDAINWALGGTVYSGNYGGQDVYLDSPNKYSYHTAIKYFSRAFTEEDPKERRKYQAKMLVSVGNLMHMVNDMKEEV